MEQTNITNASELFRSLRKLPMEIHLPPCPPESPRVAYLGQPPQRPQATSLDEEGRHLPRSRQKSNLPISHSHRDKCAMCSMLLCLANSKLVIHPAL